MEQELEAGRGESADPCSTSEIIAAGVLSLVLVGGLLAYPYLASRLADIPDVPRDDVAIDLFASPLEGTGEPALLLARPQSSGPSFDEGVIPTPAPEVPVRIVVPAIRLDAPVVEASISEVTIDGQTHKLWEAPAMHAAGWHNTSAPLGEPGNTVLSGHNTLYGEVFRDLYQLDVGDFVTVYSGEDSHEFTVSSVLILPEGGQPLDVRQENARYIMSTGDERLTLVTCHPYGSLRYRLLVIAVPADADPGA